MEGWSPRLNTTSVTILFIGLLGNILLEEKIAIMLNLRIMRLSNFQGLFKLESSVCFPFRRPVSSSLGKFLYRSELTFLIFNENYLREFLED